MTHREMSIRAKRYMGCLPNYGLKTDKPIKITIIMLYRGDMAENLIGAVLGTLRKQQKEQLARDFYLDGAARRRERQISLTNYNLLALAFP